jgi:nitroimidazol reductase NimA-like FMN-containing flavoprotein (pyridoxamine 5'-phosphate oxidase superfamily)
VHKVRWQELTKDECFRLLAGQHLGRLVLVDDRGPIALPINFVLDQHTVLFRTDEGTKLDVASRGARVGFEVDGSTRRPVPAGASWFGGRLRRSPIRWS